MSHFTTLKTQIKRQAIASRVAQRMGWTIEDVDSYVDKYNNSIAKGKVYRDAKGNVRMLSDSQGNVIVDPYYMGYDHQQFLQHYASENITQTAAMDGATVNNMGIDREGNMVLEVEY